GGEIKELGKKGEHLRLSVMDTDNNKFSAVAFGMGEFSKDFKYRRFDADYAIEENHSKGTIYLQLNIRDVRFKDYILPPLKPFRLSGFGFRRFDVIRTRSSGAFLQIFW